MSGSKDSTTTQTNEPYAGQKPFLEYGFGQAQDLYNQGPMSYYPNQTYAGFNPLQQQSQSMGADYATGQLQPFAQSAMQGNQMLAGGGMMDVNSNPWLADYAQAATRPIQQNLMEEALPMIRNSAMGAGQYGGSRQDLSEGLAVGRAADAMGDVTSNIYSNAYGQNMQGMLGAQAMAPQLAQMGMMPSNILSGIGGQQQGMEQQGINEQMQRYDFNQMAPYQQLQNYMNSVGGQMFGSQTTTPQTSSPLAGGLGGGMAGAGMAGMMNSGAAAGAGNPYMWPMMLGGAALGYFG